MKKFAYFIFCILLPVQIIMAANSAMETLKPSVEQILAILAIPQPNDSDQQNRQRSEIQSIARAIFDYVEISKRALAANWRQFSPQQRKAFTIQFAALLENTYLDKIQGQYQNERINFIEEKLLSESKALVKTEIVRSGGSAIEVDYRMLLRNGRWRIYDVNVEGVSLVKNYRSQFQSFLSKNSPDQLISKLADKSIDAD